VAPQATPTNCTGEKWLEKKMIFRAEFIYFNSLAAVFSLIGVLFYKSRATPGVGLRRF
jgi:hypothetical protein